MATLTSYPDPNPETTSCDGHIFKTNEVSWASVRTGNGDVVADTVSPSVVRANKIATPEWSVVRAWILFDTSSLGASANISSAVLSLAGDAAGVTNADSDTIHIVSSSPASNTGLATTDFTANIGSTSFANKALSAWVDTAGTYNDFTLDANGIANISKTGISKFGVRLGRDLNNLEPTGTNTFSFRSAEFAGTGSDPKLVITYTTSAIKTFNGVATAGVKTINGVAKASVKTFNGIA